MSVQKPAYSRKHIIQFLSVFFVCATLCYVTILISGTVRQTPIANDITVHVPIFCLAVVLPLLLWFDSKVRRIRALFYSAMHVTAALLMMFFLGSYNPIATMWLILCVITCMEFGFASFMMGSAFLYASSILFCILVRDILPPEFAFFEYTFYSMAFCTALVLTGYVLMRIINSSDKRRRELEEARRQEASQLSKMSTLLNSISDAILTLDTDMRVTSQNAAALSFFDTNASLVGRKITEILTVVDEKLDPIDVKELVGNVTRSAIRDDVVVQNAEQGNMRLSIQMSPIYDDNQRQGVVMVIRDITKQKTLEDEKDEFISVASHELRTPIAVAEASISNLVIMQEKGLDPAKLKSAAGTAHDEIVYLAGVVNDLSTLSRAERGVADIPEPVDLTKLFHDLYTKYEPEAQKKSLHLNLDLAPNLPIVEVSRLYIEEMLQNFITNALKYTKEGSITLRTEEVAGGVKCAVSDTGIGISKTDQKHLGEKFFRSEDYRTRETNGTGLGLYVVEKLALKIGTKIDVDSRLNHGSTFSVTLPLKSTVHTTGKRSSET